MMIHEITEKVGKYKTRKRIGRGHGSGAGKTSGRGHKGARSRSGFSRRPAFEGGQMQYFRRIPKRGFSNAEFKTIYHIVNIASLVDRFKKGATVDATALVEAGLIRNFKNPVKILGQGDIDIALNITADKFSASAVTKIEAAGGNVTVIERKKWKRQWPEKTKTKKTKEPAKAEVAEEIVEEVAETIPVEKVEPEAVEETEPAKEEEE
jgi:large subunit ribosomal protein L15